MPKYFCEYCGIYLTHSSPGGRKQHSHGRKHINNKIEFYSQFLYEFQQNTYNNLMTMAEKINNPLAGSIKNPLFPQQAPQQMTNMYQRLVMPTNQMKQGYQMNMQMFPQNPNE